MTTFSQIQDPVHRVPEHGHVDRLLLHIARQASAMRLADVRYVPPPVEVTPRPHGVFVTLWDQRHELRGSSGRLGPLPSLSAAVAECAQSAALHDDRFAPVSPEELPDLSIEISLLEPPQPVSHLGALDPAVYGVLVEQNGRSGVLLPGIDGVDTPEDQVAIACRKGFIDPMQRFDIARFRVRTVHE
jgi:AmmeMemoRadiSam system protein A